MKDDISLSCPECGKYILIHDKWDADVVKCTYCKSFFDLHFEESTKDDLLESNEFFYLVKSNSGEIMTSKARMLFDMGKNLQKKSYLMDRTVQGVIGIIQNGDVNITLEEFQEYHKLVISLTEKGIQAYIDEYNRLVADIYEYLQGRIKIKPG